MPSAKRATKKETKQPAPRPKQPPAPTAQPGGGTTGWKAMAPTAGKPDLKAQLAGLNAAREALLVSGAPTTALDAIEQEAAEIQRQLKDLRPTGEKLEGLRGVIRRGERRLQEAEKELERIQAQIKNEQEEITLHKDELAALETELVQELQGPPEVPPWLKDTLLQLAGHLRSGGPIDPQQIAASIEGLTIPPPAPEPAENPGEEEDETPVIQASTYAKVSRGTGKPSAAWTTVVPTRLRTKTQAETPQLGARGSTWADQETNAMSDDGPAGQ